MSYVIDLFMWGYQQHMQISLQVSAEGLFNLIDPKLKPTVFFLGVLVDDRTDRHPICIEPEGCGYSVKAFTEIKTLAQALESVDEEKRIMQTHPLAQEWQDKRISNRAFIEAIHKILKREDLYSNREKFISYPTYVDGFLVFVILEMDKDILNGYYSLTKDKFNDRYKISRSFTESTINVFLNECSNALKDPNQSLNAIKRQPDELLREAAKEFMYSISNVGGNFFGLHGLYDACNTIASLKYEGTEGLGKIVIAKTDHENVRFTLQLTEPISIRDFRKVRKFLELSNADSLIISDSAYIYGLGEIMGKYNPKDESLFIINFISHYKWEVSHDNNVMMVVEYRQPNIPQSRIDRNKFYSDLRRIFLDIDKSQLDNLWEITMKATKQSHGTMLVITDNAKDEAMRLGKQSFALKPLKLSANIIQQITSIDGSVLLDRDSICHSIGVILDGLATDKGDSSRGARFNSAVRYYEHFGKRSPTIIIIVSEDGMINLIPNLRPQIKHSLILDMIEELSKLSKQKKLDRASFYKIKDSLRQIEFYLSDEECKIINELGRTIEENDKDIESVRPMWQDFKPNKEMDDSHYLD